MVRSVPLALALAAALAAAPARAAGDAAGDDDDDDSAPAVVAEVSAESERAEALFAAGLLGQAAPLLFRVAAGEAGDPDERRQIAGYHLGVALYRLRFPNASFLVFSSIAARPGHARYRETLLWLVKLAGDLADPDVVAERIGLYGAASLSRFGLPAERPLRDELAYWLGRDAYRRRDYEEAARLLSEVGRGSPRFLDAQVLAGIAYVLDRRPAPAVLAFRRVVKEGPANAESRPASTESGRARDRVEAARMKNLALLSIGRTLYSTSFHFGTGGASIDKVRLLHAVNDAFGRVAPWSPLWQESLFDQAWGYFMLGDYPRALGNLHAVESPYFRDKPTPEADILRAITHFTLCRYDDAAAAAARALARHRPVRARLEDLVARLSTEGGEGRFLEFLDEVQGGTARLPDAIWPFIRSALSGRDLARRRAAVRDVDEETARLRRAPASFRGSSLGADMTDGLSLARDLSVLAAGSLVRSRLERALSDLDRTLGDARKIQVDIANARARARTRGRAAPAPDDGPDEIILASDGVEVWPFDGEYWPDEMGHYQQLVTSRCAP